MSVPSSGQPASAVKGSLDQIVTQEFNSLYWYSPKSYPQLMGRLVHDADIQQLFIARYKASSAGEGFLNIADEGGRIVSIINALYELTEEKHRSEVLRPWIDFVVASVSENESVDDHGRTRGSYFAYQLNAEEFSSRLWSKLIAIDSDAFLNETFWLNMLQPFFITTGWDQGEAPAILILSKLMEHLKAQGKAMPLPVIQRISELKRNTEKVRSLLEWFNRRLYSDSDQKNVADFLGQNQAMLAKHSRASKGGIDLDPSQLKVDIQGQGKDFQFNVDPAMFENVAIDGAEFLIINTTPMTNLPLFLGLQAKDTEENPRLNLAQR